MGKTAQAGWYADPWREAPLRWWDGTEWTAETTGPPPFEPAAPTLGALVGAGGRVAVVDVETTGLYTADRVLEVAIVTLDASGVVVEEFETLVNPNRDVGPVWLHGVTSSMVRDAPTGPHTVWVGHEGALATEPACAPTGERASTPARDAQGKPAANQVSDGWQAGNHLTKPGSPTG